LVSEKSRGEQKGGKEEEQRKEKGRGSLVGGKTHSSVVTYLKGKNPSPERKEKKEKGKYRQKKEKVEG